MVADEQFDHLPMGPNERSEGPAQTGGQPKTKVPKWRQLLGISKAELGPSSPSVRSSTDGYDEIKAKPEKWSMGVLNDKETEEVPGMLKLLLLCCCITAQR